MLLLTWYLPYALPPHDGLPLHDDMCVQQGRIGIETANKATYLLSLAMADTKPLLAVPT